MKQACRFGIFCLAILAVGSGCATVGCEVNPLKPEKAVQCEMAI